MGDPTAAQRAVRAERRRVLRGQLDPNPGANRFPWPPRKTMASPPTVTLGAQSGSPTVTDPTQTSRVSTAYRYFGAIPVNTSPWYTAGPKTLYWAVDFETDAAAIDIGSQSGPTAGLYRLIVDGEYVTADAQSGLVGSGGNYYITVAFGSNQPRHIVIEMDATFLFGGIYTDESESVWTSSTPAGPRVAILGDSFTEGATTGGTVNGIQAWGVEAMKRLGYRDIFSSGSGGTGYLNPGTGGRVKFRDRVQAHIIAVNPVEVWVAGGINDAGGYTAGAIQTEAGLLFDAIKAGLPTAKLVVFSNWYPGGNPNSTVLGVRDAIQTAATGKADLFVDSIVATVAGLNTLGWYRGTGKAGSLALNGNADRYVIADGTHPSPAGHKYLGARAAQARAALIGAQSV